MDAGASQVKALFVVRRNTTLVNVAMAGWACSTSKNERVIGALAEVRDAVELYHPSAVSLHEVCSEEDIARLSDEGLSQRSSQGCQKSGTLRVLSILSVKHFGAHDAVPRRLRTAEDAARTQPMESQNGGGTVGHNNCHHAPWTTNIPWRSTAGLPPLSLLDVRFCHYGMLAEL